MKRIQKNLQIGILFSFSFILGSLDPLNGSFAAESPPLLPGVSNAAKPSVSEQTEFLKLPAYELAIVSEKAPENSGEKFKVGDALSLQLQNFPSQKTPAEAAPSQNGALDSLKLELPSFEDRAKNPNWTFLSSFKIGILKPGKIVIPGLSLIDEKTGKAIGRTLPLTLEAESAIQTTDPKPAEPENNLPPVGVEFPKAVVIALSGLLLLVLAGMGYGIYRWVKRKRLNRPVILDSVQTEDEIALQALRDLEESPLILNGKFKLFYFRLSEILKAYLGARYQFDALESTSFELISILKQKSENSPLLLNAGVSEISAFFDQLDRVKFTDYFPTEQEPIALLEAVRNFILKSKNSKELSSVPVSVSGVGENAIR